MRLSGFHIKNFRSIVDTGCNCLSTDNISVLIGQNESGKTSVLEALYSFYKGTVYEDVLRSDMGLPRVSCTFTAEPEEIEQVLQKNRLLEEVADAIRKSGNITLTRSWDHNLQSNLLLSGKEVTDIFDRHEKERNDKIQRVLNQVRELTAKDETLRGEISDMENSILQIKQKKNELAGKLSKTKKLFPGKIEKEKKRKEAGFIQNEINKLEEQIKNYCTRINEKKGYIEKTETVSEYGKQILLTLEQAKNKNGSTLESPLTSDEPETGDIQRQLLYKTSVMEKILNGYQLFAAEKEASEETESAAKYLSAEEAGNEFFSLLPRFVFFEDFSSLLPNRIDLEDILNNNTKSEGYKAVKNFLIVAGLEPEFFMQSNNRIMKQKIENLNGEITVNFREYWRQNVGKTNKIRINFELEHYDYSHPDKKGKPYLEFWIKDDHERLYPKQRSRGVRWFLSFYLELKANAIGNGKQKQVLLIDEPGLSLHARAQEDVLKVFEYIKDSMQVIYTTHSPHLIDLNRLYRLMAIQRAQEGSDCSETVVYSAHNLHATTNDTLSPLYSVMGTRLWEQPFVQKKNNVIIEGINSYNYLTALYRMSERKKKIFFIPAGGAGGAANIANIMLGWGVEFVILKFNGESKEEGEYIDGDNLLEHFAGNSCESGKLAISKEFGGPEELFSALDFKKHILKKRTGITGSNTSYIKENNLSNELLSAAFSAYSREQQLTLKDFDEETAENINRLFELIEKGLAGKL